MSEYFIGKYNITLDGKGRFNVPSKVKGTLEENYGSNLVICVMTNYLVVFPYKVWAVKQETLNNLDAFNDSDRQRIRQVYLGAAECEIKSGKILIPANQRERVGLTEKKDAVLVGMGTSFEIWNQDEVAKISG